MQISTRLVLLELLFLLIFPTVWGTQCTDAYTIGHIIHFVSNWTGLTLSSRISWFDVKGQMRGYIEAPCFIPNISFPSGTSQRYDIQTKWHFHFFPKTSTINPGDILSLKGWKTFSVAPWSTSSFAFLAKPPMLTGNESYNETADFPKSMVFQVFLSVHLAFQSSFTQEAAQ